MVTIKQPDIWGRLGTGFGKGISEALSNEVPKIVERNRLAQGLDNLQNMSNLNPTQQYAHLLRSGANESQIAQILPLLERANANREAQMQAGANLPTPVKGKAEKTKKEIPTILNESENSIIPNEGKPGKKVKPSLVTKETEQAALTFLPDLTTLERRTRGAELRSSYPNLYKTQAEAESEAVRERTEEQSQLQQMKDLGITQKAIRQTLEEETAKRLGYDIENPTVQGQISETYGTYYKDLLDEADAEVASGNKSTQEAANEISNKLKEFADLRTTTKKEAKKWFWKESSAKEQIKSFDNQRKKYKKHGQLKTAVNLLIDNGDLSRARASYMMYPLSENKDINNIYSGIKELNPLKETGTKYFNDRDTKAIQFAKDISNHIKPSDSLLSIATALNDKNINGTAFLDEIQNLYDKGKISLSPLNLEELEQRDLTPTLGDWWLFGSSKTGRSL